MHRSSWLLAAFALVGPAGQDPVEHGRLLQEAQRLARLQPPHQRLQALVGDWTVEVVARGRDGREQTGRGTVAAAAILGGRYVVCTMRLELPGGRVEAVQILGFDTQQQQWTSSWRDDLSTWAVEARGAFDPAAPTRAVLEGQLIDAHDPTGRPFRMTLELGQPDRVEVAVQETASGTELLRQRQVWTRR